MKSQHWIEFLVTFIIFLIVLLTFTMSWIRSLSSFSVDISRIDNFQKILLGTFYYTNGYDIKYASNILNYPFILVSKPSVIFVNYKYYPCTNCIEIYYSNDNQSINIVQITLIKNLNSSVNFYIFNFFSELNYTTNNATLNCRNIYGSVFSYYGIYYRSFYYCNAILSNNASISILTGNNLLGFTDYKSSLYIYNGEKMIGYPTYLTYFSTISDYISFFTYFNNSIIYNILS
ncbi:MAG: hypothetical protein ACP5G1_00865 [Nanopusillaceae archaeon]